MYTNQILDARALATVVGHNITALDTSPAIVLQYVPDRGAGGVGSTSVGKVEIKAAGLRFKVDDDTPSGLDAAALMNSSGWLLFATYTNMGQIVDAINGGAAWRAYLVASLRGDIASNMLVVAEAVVSGVNGRTFFWDSKDETLISAGIAVSGERFINNGINGHVKDADDACENTIMFIEANFVDSVATLTFYSASRTAEAQIGGALTHTADGTAVLYGDSDPSDPFISAKRGERLIARVTFLTKAKGTPNRFHVLGKTAVLKNDRVVTQINYGN